MTRFFLKATTPRFVWGVVAVASLAQACSDGLGPLAPRSSPASTASIAFVSSGVDSVSHIYVLDLDHSTVTQLTHGAVWDDAPAWSPDRRSIAFLRGGDSSTAGIWLMAADGSGAVRLTSLPGVATWSPDGRKMAVMSRNSITIMNTDGSGVVGVIGKLPGLMWYSGAAAWSPDGSTIAFTFFGEPPGCWGRCQWVVLMNPDGSNVRPVTTTFSRQYGAAWSPDGRRLAFRSLEFGITVVNRDGSGAFSVTKERPENWGSPDWSPEGDRLVFSDWSGGQPQLVVTRADGTGAVHPVTALPYGDGDPAWSR